MVGEGDDPLWAWALPVDPLLSGPFPPSLSVPVPAPYPDQFQGFSPPAAAADPVTFLCPERGSASPRGRIVCTEEKEYRTLEAALVEFQGCCEEEYWCRAVAARLPGKTWEDVREHYQRLERVLMGTESGITPLPEYADGLCDSGAGAGWSDSVERTKSGNRRKGFTWTEEEHSQFLQGLEKYGKGDWRSISRHAVVTRTPTQVASHAQKYFLRLSRPEGKKNRRRSSMHDVVTVT